MLKRSKLGDIGVVTERTTLLIIAVVVKKLHMPRFHNIMVLNSDYCESYYDFVGGKNFAF